MLAPPWIPVPPPGYGGIESVVALLCDALVERGHEVELFCAPGSSSTAVVRAVLEAPQSDSISSSLFEADHVGAAFASIEGGTRSGFPIDVVHDHSGYTALAMADRLAVPLVHTVHAPFGQTAAFYARHARKGALVCISRAQADDAPAGVEVTAVVPNPIDVASWPTAAEKSDYLLWVGRLVPEKGPQRAIEVASAANHKLLLAGPVQPGYERFFAKEVEPYLANGRIRYVGEVSTELKMQLFAEATALLMPIRWPEPFGMVMVEALAAGTPVVAFEHGAAPEIVEHGVTGFLARDEHEMAALVNRVDEIDPDRCRGAVMDRWTPAHVAELYEAVYRRALGGLHDEHRARSTVRDAVRHAAQHPAPHALVADHQQIGT